MKRMIVPGGLLFLAVPVGQDVLVWNGADLWSIKTPSADGWLDRAGCLRLQGIAL